MRTTGGEHWPPLGVSVRVGKVWQPESENLGGVEWEAQTVHLTYTWPFCP